MRTTIGITLVIDILKDFILDRRLPMQSVMAPRVDAGMTLGRVAMIPHDSNLLVWQDGTFNVDEVVLPRFLVDGGEDTESFLCMEFRLSVGKGGMSPAASYNLISLNAYTPRFLGCHHVPQSPFVGATSGFQHHAMLHLRCTIH